MNLYQIIQLMLLLQEKKYAVFTCSKANWTKMEFKAECCKCGFTAESQHLKWLVHTVYRHLTLMHDQYVAVPNARGEIKW